MMVNKIQIVGIFELIFNSPLFNFLKNPLCIAFKKKTVREGERIELNSTVEFNKS